MPQGYEIKKNFAHHPPTPGLQQAHEEVRHAARVFAEIVNLAVRESREKSLALTKIEEAMMWANAGIARNG